MKSSTGRFLVSPTKTPIIIQEFNALRNQFPQHLRNIIERLGLYTASKEQVLDAINESEYSYLLNQLKLEVVA